MDTAVSFLGLAVSGLHVHFMSNPFEKLPKLVNRIEKS